MSSIYKRDLICIGGYLGIVDLKTLHNGERVVVVVVELANTL